MRHFFLGGFILHGLHLLFQTTTKLEILRKKWENNQTKQTTKQTKVKNQLRNGQKSVSTHCKQHIEEDKEAFDASVNFPHLQSFFCDWLSEMKVKLCVHVLEPSVCDEVQQCEL